MTADATIREHSAGAETALAALVDDLLSRLRAGDNLDADQILADHPQFASRLRDILPGLRAMCELTTDKDFRPTESAGDVSAANDVLAGVLGDFRILREIGRGGMGIVYEAIQTSLNRRVALKVLPLAAMLDPRHLQRFKNEAMAAASLDHPNIVEVHAVGCERGVHFYAMRYVEGQTLAAVIDGLSRSHAPRGNASLAAPRREREVPNDCANRAPIDDAPELRTSYSVPAANSSLDSLKPEPSPPAAAGTLNPASDTLAAALSTLRTEKPRDFYRLVAELGIQAAEALDHAHQLGIVHRDIKPSNLMVESVVSGQLSVVSDRQRTTDNGQRTTPKLYITDFGLARIESDAGVGLTMTGDLLGTLRYMSPEQAEGRTAILDHRTDIYSLGITLYELLILRPAFPGEDRQALLRQIANDEPLPPRKLNSAIPADLETIVLKSIAKDPLDRYASARSLADDLRRYLSQQPLNARRPTLLDRTRRWAARHFALLGAAMLTLSLIAASGIAATVLIAHAYKSESEHRTEAETNLRLANENLQLAADAVESLMVRLVSDPNYVGGNLHAVERLISNAMDFHDRLLSQSDDPKLLNTAALSCRRAIWLRLAAGVPDRAESAARRASDLFERLLHANPDSVDNLHMLGNNELELGRILWVTDQHAAAEIPWMRSLAIYEDLHRRAPNEPVFQMRLADALAYLGRWRLHFGRTVEAEDLLDRSAEEGKGLPDEDGAVYTVFDALRWRGALLQAQAELARQRGDCEQALDLLASAVECQQSAIKRAPTDPWAKDFLREHHRNRASVLIQGGRHEEAAKAVDVLVQQFSTWQDAYHRGAELLLLCAGLSKHTGEQYRARARELVEKADKLPMRSTVSQDHFAWFLLTCPDESFRDPARALKLAESVTTTVPERLLAWRTLSLAHYRLGQWDDAETALQYFLDNETGDSTDHTALFLLAMIQWQQGDRGEAQRTFKRAATQTLPERPRNPILITLSAEAASLLKE